MIRLGYRLNMRLVRAANCDHDFKKKWGRASWCSMEESLPSTKSSIQDRNRKKQEPRYKSATEDLLHV